MSIYSLGRSVKNIPHFENSDHETFCNQAKTDFVQIVILIPKRIVDIGDFSFEGMQ